MRSMPQLVRKGKKDRRMGGPRGLSLEEIRALELDSRVELIRQLIPLGLAEVGRELDEEVEELAGRRHARKVGPEGRYRHGHNPGSVRLGGQRHPVTVPRVRGPRGEVRLASYDRLHGSSGEADESLFRKVLLEISCRDYEAAAEPVPGAIGMSKSTAAKLDAFRERDLSRYGVVALFLDGREDLCRGWDGCGAGGSDGGGQGLSRLRPDRDGERVAITSFLRRQRERGLDLSVGALAVLGGAKGPRSAVRRFFKGQVLIERRKWHKRENVISHLPNAEQKSWRQRLQRAYQRPTCEEASPALEGLRMELGDLNQSAAASLEEGLEETLTLHRLGVFPLAGRSLKTTKVLESVNAQAEQRCGQVDHWKTSSRR